MSYPKRFFLVFSVVLACAFLAVGWLVGNWLPSWVLWPWGFIAICAAAMTGRVSGGLAEVFARLAGKLILTPVGTGLARFVLGRSIQAVEALRTANGVREVQYVDFGYDKVLEGMKAKGIKPTELLVNAEGFRAYLETARYQDYHPGYYKGTPDYLAQKRVQHYLSTVITPVEGKVVWMDVASSTSPFAEILTRLYGIKVYRQDLSYPPGVEGLRIGSDASAIPLPDGAVDRISLHCSFEHFEGDADSKFLRELGRILSPGGSAAIIPLYVSNTYRILTNPHYWLKRGVPQEVGCQVTVSGEYRESHGRFYDWEALERRVLRPLSEAKLDYEIIRVTVPAGIDYPPFVVLKITKSTAA
jgi:hypothetical protein